MTNAVITKHWNRLQRSLGRRYREWRLPRGYVRLGTRYGGWWIDERALSKNPLLIDCGLGRDISFPRAFLERFGGQVIGIDPHPQAVRYAEAHRPESMEIRQNAFWGQAGHKLTFHLPRPQDELPKGADGISGSLLASHSYAGADTVEVTTTSFAEVMRSTGRDECDVLKLDIEGAEYDVLADLCASGTIKEARQVLIEFHHHCTDHPIEDTLAAVRALQASGFALTHTEGRNYIFRRSDFDRG
jgi:FkbM family methyltransferase